jgi:hypothetical protein
MVDPELLRLYSSPKDSSGDKPRHGRQGPGQPAALLRLHGPLPYSSVRGRNGLGRIHSKIHNLLDRVKSSLSTNKYPQLDGPQERTLREANRALTTLIGIGWDDLALVTGAKGAENFQIDCVADEAGRAVDKQKVAAEGMRTVEVVGPVPGALLNAL